MIQKSVSLPMPLPLQHLAFLWRDAARIVLMGPHGISQGSPGVKNIRHIIHDLPQSEGDKQQQQQQQKSRLIGAPTGAH